jgi:hypothetical protein
MKGISGNVLVDPINGGQRERGRDAEDPQKMEATSIRLQFNVNVRVSHPVACMGVKLGL